LIKAQPADKQLLIELLSKSFNDNQSVNHIIRQDHRKSKRIRALMEYSLEVCSINGEVWLSDDKQACALILYPHEKRLTILSAWLDVKLIFRAIGIAGIRKILEREALIKNAQCKENVAYLWFIGVNPLRQHLGIGSQLLKEVISDAAKKGLPVCLETSVLSNLPWYQRFGFQVYNQITLTYTLYFLKKNPK
jgi:GNAT superfamily N-acetyltransferase